jgi:hypothetical protein
MFYKLTFYSKLETTLNDSDVVLQVLRSFSGNSKEEFSFKKMNDPKKPVSTSPMSSNSPKAVWVPSINRGRLSQPIQTIPSTTTTTSNSETPLKMISLSSSEKRSSGFENMSKQRIRSLNDNLLTIYNILSSNTKSTNPNLTSPSDVTSSGNTTTTTIVSTSPANNPNNNQNDYIIETIVTNQIPPSKSSPTLFETQKTTQFTKWSAVQPVSAFPLPKTTTTNKIPVAFIPGSLPKETSMSSISKETDPNTNETNFIVPPKAKTSSVVQSDKTNDRTSSWKFSQDIHKIEPKK